MYEPDPRMVQHLLSRHTQWATMAAALHLAIDRCGLRLPSRGDLARVARVSNATVSRRLTAIGSEQHLIQALVSAREWTHPRGYLEDGWVRWLPDAEREVADVRVWLACLELAAGSPDVALAVRESWARERRAVADQLVGRRFAAQEHDGGTALDAELVQSLILGLSIRRVLDAALTHERSKEIVGRAVSALGHESGRA